MYMEMASKVEHKGIRTDSWFNVGVYGQAEEQHTNWDLGPFHLTRVRHPEYVMGETTEGTLKSEKYTSWQFRIERQHPSLRKRRFFKRR